MKKLFIYISFLYLILSFGCKTKSYVDLNQKKKLDEKYSTELITQVVEDEKESYLIADCISEEPRIVFYSMYSDTDEYLKKLLKIKDVNHYNSQIKSFKDFKITSEIVPNKNIMTQKQFADYEEKAEKEGINSMFWMKQDCAKGFCSISKPIFNETFNLAYIEVSKYCEGMFCSGGEARIYELVKGKWEIKKMLYNWING